jgi:adenosylhomocysteine nucleosidase
LSGILLTLVLGVLPCASLFADTAVLVALPSELDGMRKEVRLVGQPVELAQHKVSIGYRKGEKVYIVRTGAGILNATTAMQALVTRYKIDRVISIGVAGNLNDDWKVGDVLVASDVVNHQQGKETPAGFEAKKESEPRTQKSESYWKTCEAFRSNAVEIATAIIKQPQAETPTPADAEKLNAESRKLTANLRQGRLVSGDSFIASSVKRKWLRETFETDAVDMVSAGIAGVCEANGVPYVIIRVLSDNANESASTDFAAFVQSAKEPITVPIALQMLDHLVTTVK